MVLKYCFTSLSVPELAQASLHYEGFSYDNVRDFWRNSRTYEKMQDSRVDVIYVYSKFLRNASELWWIFSGNILITNDSLVWVDENGSFRDIPKNSIVYLLRLGDIPSSFLSFLVRYAKKRWNVEIITSSSASDLCPLSTKCHSLAYLEPNELPTSIVPYICDKSDFSYLATFIADRTQDFGNRIIVKKAGYSSWEGVRIIQTELDLLRVELADFLSDHRTRDYIVMKCVETEDLEYRAYWHKKNGQVRILAVHAKERKEGHMLHNIAQWNTLRRQENDFLSSELKKKIVDYCANIPEFHGGLDILHSKDGAYYLTENNIMTGYLSEPEEAYFAQEWLDAVADCYQ